MITSIFPTNGRLCIHYKRLLPEAARWQIENYLQNHDIRWKHVDVIRFARTKIGADYRRGSKKTDATFDCSSFTQRIYAEKGMYIPRISIEQFLYGNEVSKDTLVPGDLLFTRGARPYTEHVSGDRPMLEIGHVGIYTGKNVIHAASSERGVVEDSLSDFCRDQPWYASRIYEDLAEARTLLFPKDCDIETDRHLRWRILQTLR